METLEQILDKWSNKKIVYSTKKEKTKDLASTIRKWMRKKIKYLFPNFIATLSADDVRKIMEVD